MKRYVFIYNPAARNGQSESLIAELEMLIDGLESATLFRSKRKGDIRSFVQKQLSKFDVFVACGGDGTIREVAAELVDTDKTLGIIPLGSGNDLCKTLEIPTDLQHAFALLRRESAQKIDVGKCNDFIFLNTLGFGFDGLTNQYANRLAWLPPFMRYAVAALKASWTHRRFSVHFVNNNHQKKELIMLTIANGRVEGGTFWISPEASISDGRLDILQVRSLPKLLIPILLPLFLLKKGSWLPQVQLKRDKKCVLTVDSEIEIHADGETIETEDKSFKIDVLPAALNVICGL